MADIERTSASIPSSWERIFPQKQYSFNVAFFTARNCFQQDRLTPNSLHAIFAFIMPVLLNFLELMYQGKDYSPFDTHPITMWVALTSSLAYCLAYGIEMTYVNNFQSPFYVTAIHRSRAWFGSMSLASLASIFFPDSVQPFLYMLCTLLSVGESLYTSVFWKWIWRILLQALHAQDSHGRQISANAPVSNSSMNQRNILPV